jgi:hypothetical protein
VVDGRRYVVGGRWEKEASWRQGLKQDPGFRSQNEEHLLSAFCLLLTADSLLHLKGVRVGGSLGPYGRLRQDVNTHRERKN